MQVFAAVGAVLPPRSGLACCLALTLALTGACSSDEDGGGKSPSDGEPDAKAGVDSGGADAGKTLIDARVNTPSRDASLVVPRDASVCGLNLPFQPIGCGCSAGETVACWTGPADRRNVGDCRDGIQTCESKGEFGGTWSECEGQQLDCGEPPPEECGCVPGQVIGCDEDCEALVICLPNSTKECQPDGTWGRCRESLLPTGAATQACINFFHGCLPGNREGIFTGDCGGAYTCGTPPGGITAL